MRDSQKLLRQTLQQRYEQGEARAITELVLEELTGLDRTARLMHLDDVLPQELRRRIAEVAALLAEGIPVQHALGYETFCGRHFMVNGHVLIPRPETAELVRWVEEDATMEESLKILDVGTGSGCIAITLAAELPAAEVTALDVSAEALEVARSNAAALAVGNVRFVQQDILAAATGEERDAEPEAMYDVIVSNPPYICDKERDEMEPVVLDHEPSLALFVPDEDPMLFYRSIGQYALRHLKPGGRLYYEINEKYGKETIETLRQLGFEHPVLRNDCFDRPRMVSVIRK